MNVSIMFQEGVSTRVSTIYVLDFSNQLNSEMCVMQEYRAKGNGVVSQHPGQCEEGDTVGLEILIHPWDRTGVQLYLQCIWKTKTSA
jgi:hypothetical protein